MYVKLLALKKLSTVALVIFASIVLALIGCASEPSANQALTDDRFPQAQAEIRAVIDSIAADIMTANISGLQDIHLDGDKFTKFGPRQFERQDVTATNASEAAFFSSISNANYEVEDLKIDVFGDVGIATYYPRVSFERDGEAVRVTGRQTLVFLNTVDGWKIVHEHGTVRN